MFFSLFSGPQSSQTMKVFKTTFIYIGLHPLIPMPFKLRPAQLIQLIFSSPNFYRAQAYPVLLFLPKFVMVSVHWSISIWSTRQLIAPGCFSGQQLVHLLLIQISIVSWYVRISLYDIVRLLNSCLDSCFFEYRSPVY